MSTYFSALRGDPTSPKSREIVLWSSKELSTGGGDSVIISELGNYAYKTLYVDTTGALTGGMTDACTFDIAIKADNFPLWVDMRKFSNTQTAAFYIVKPTGQDAGDTSSGGSLWVNFDQLKISCTNPNTGAVGKTDVTATINVVLSVSE